MILYRRTGRLYDQEELARYFGVRVSPDSQSAFSEKMLALTAQNFDEGVSTLRIVSAVQQICDQLSIDVRVRAHEFENPKKLEETIVWALENEGDIWCEFVDGPFDTPQQLLLHDNLIESYDSGAQILTLIDPAGYKKNRYTMSFSEFIIRVSGKYGRKTGVLTVTSREIP
jgi:hypothetical protein